MGTANDRLRGSFKRMSLLGAAFCMLASISARAQVIPPNNETGSPSEIVKVQLANSVPDTIGMLERSELIGVDAASMSNDVPIGQALAWIGYGPTTDAPWSASWTWFPLTLTPSGSNYVAFPSSLFLAPSVDDTTLWSLTYRFSIDSGATATYADRNGAGSGSGFDFDQGQLMPFYVFPSCCTDRVGNVNGDPVGQVDIADVIYFVDHFFINNPPLPCLASANVNRAGNVDIEDLYWLIGYLFFGLYNPLPTCP